MNTLLLWVVFHVFVVALLLFDLGVVQRRDREMSIRTALWLSLGYIALALAFAAGVFHFRGSEAGYEFLTGYFIEKSLSVDNIFVFLLIFLHFSVPRHAQRKILFFGVLGALVMRAAMIFAGAAAISAFHWLLYVFGVFLVASGVKMLVAIDQEPDMERNRIVRFMRSRFRVTDEYEGEKFWVRRNGLWYMTPMFIVLVIVEASDLIFALDSIPAILAVSHDTFIVYSSNVFAILGLRALFFAVSHVVDRFHYLKYGLSVVLVVIGVKMVINAALGPVIETEWALLATAAIIGGSVWLSILRTRGLPPQEAAQDALRGWVPGSPVKDPASTKPLGKK